MRAYLLPFLLLLAGLTSPASAMASLDGGARPSAEDVQLAEEILRSEATLSILAGLGSSLGGPTTAIDFATIEPYIRDRLLTAIRQRGMGDDPERVWDSAAVYDELVAMPIIPVARAYFKEAARSKDPLFRSIGLAKLARLDSARADDYIAQALNDPHQVVRCEGIATLVALKGQQAVPRLKPLDQWSSLLERCEVAASLVRLGEEDAVGALDKALSELRGGSIRPPSYDWDHSVWMPRRDSYYSLTLASARVKASEEGACPLSAEADLRSDFAALPSLLPLVGDHPGYLRPVLEHGLRDQDPETRARAVRCLGRISEAWATGLLKTRLNDTARCTLNPGGYGWNASVGCLAAICLLERGDESGLDVLRSWDKGGTGPTVALARAGYGDVAGVLHSVVEEAFSMPTDVWDSSPAWWAYHLARLGDPEGIRGLRRQLQMTRHGRAVEAAGAIIALSQERGRPLLYAPARDIGGPVLYPDCVSKPVVEEAGGREAEPER